MKSIIDLFSKHGTFVQPDTLEYILSKNNPEEFTSNIIGKLREYPFVLTIEQVKNIEQEDITKNEINPCKDIIEKKEIQKNILTKIYDNVLQSELLIEETDQEYDELENDKQIISKDQNVSDLTDSPKIEIKKIKSWKPTSYEYDPEIEIIKDITGKSTCEGKTSDFTKLFLNRYNVVRKILRSQRREMANVIPINRVKRSNSKEIQIVGIIKDIRVTRNGHKLLEIEDETGSLPAILLKDNRETNQMASEIILDEILGLKCQLSKDGDLLVVQNIIFPDISIQNEKHKSEVPVCAAFLSDIHIGSKQFMEKEWQAFIKWINGDMGSSRQKDVAGKIKYLVIPGDVVDGIGIYPNQDKELSIIDVYRQYEALAEHLQSIPDSISIIMQPGNHDAVRPAEPQPAFEKEIRDLFCNKDITFIGNPCYFSLHGVEILSYHGQSLLDYATNIQCLRYNEPVEIMKIMLKKHHLSPVYGGYTPLAPEHFDYMVIDKIPDIFVTGHVHLATIGEYRGVTLINASSWQSQTSYQKMLNFIPDPAKLPIADLKNGKVTMMNFSGK
jgi:DNA polymerase II small subunit